MTLTSTNPTVDPYVVLQIDRRADESAIKKAYFRLVRQYPPEQEPEKFQEIRVAYELLRSAESRAKVDLFLLQPPPALPNRRRPTYDLTVHVEDLDQLALELGLARHAPDRDFRVPPLPTQE
ncbi:MAG: J domain-containing protein [Caldilineaceae bacterium]|nr:J domain-containing protein [Caldilineaceae bacterium]MBP8106799.1 J domain-containing protein [Caldilineaceae bacterium]MBP8124897.1 J domain-containing protein [Caldilineaceae bacterium]MBP9071812.1 J domain-containing protein [Caldilineaceae bacterium]